MISEFDIHNIISLWKYKEDFSKNILEDINEQFLKNSNSATLVWLKKEIFLTNMLLNNYPLDEEDRENGLFFKSIAEKTLSMYNKMKIIE